MSKNPKQKIQNKKPLFFQIGFFLKTKKTLWWKKMLFYLFFNIRRTQFDQSSLVQSVSDFRGGSTNLTEEESGQRTEILLCNTRYMQFSWQLYDKDITKFLLVFLVFQHFLYIQQEGTRRERPLRTCMASYFWYRGNFAWTNPQLDFPPPWPLKTRQGRPRW